MSSQSELDLRGSSVRMRRQPSNDGETASVRSSTERPCCQRFQIHTTMYNVNVWLRLLLGAAQLVGDSATTGPGSVNHTGVPEKILKATAAAAAHPRAFHGQCTLCETRAHCQEATHHSRARAAVTLSQLALKPAGTPLPGPVTAPLSPCPQCTKLWHQAGAAKLRNGLYTSPSAAG